MPTSPSSGAASFPDATDALYQAFRDVAFRDDMVRCAHCVTAAEVAELAHPVRALDPAVVGRFVTKAGTTWGDPHDLRRVAPRALHLAAENRLPVNRTVVLEKLTAAGWARWPDQQVDAVCRFLLAEWERLLRATPRAGHSAHRWLRQTATAVADLEPFLTAWHRALATASGPPAVHLAVLLVNSEFRPDFPSSITDLFEPTGPTGPIGPDAAATATPLADQLGRWLVADATEHHLARAVDDLGHTTDARRLGLAVERLRRYRASRSVAG